MTNGGGIHHGVKKKPKHRKNQSKPVPRTKPTKALLAKAVAGN